ncbi:MAG TPA: transporter substrate-binding domain-containing protein [Acetobacteraceae bacterium]|nr:transporter substrate-binding domain-containing protein [Acetobacteraceae bacterium]
MVVPFGLLFSREGPYATVSRAMFNGALLAVEELEHDADAAIALEPLGEDPAGRTERYPEIADHLLRRHGVRHVVGCYTSSSRKECIPLFERADALLWYPSHYEGFESSANVLYTGAVPNQHLLPLADFMQRAFGSRAFCIGSNYIWAWENNRILRERLAAMGGQVVAERYFPVGETAFDQVIAAIIAARPSFVFNTLIGTSAYRFMAGFRAACCAQGIDQGREIPIASCTLSEPELEEIGPAAADGHITSSVYFSTIQSAENARFTGAYARRFPAGPAICADAEAAYIAVRLLAAALEAAGPEAGSAEVKRAAGAITLAAPQGPVRIDPETWHAALTPRIARSTKAMRFEILKEAPGPAAADPYLIWNSPRFWVAPAPPSLRVAS